ncbi:MAG: efflux RND transporter permease subunit [Bryobacteraceae bacterium]|nr:efflux RND transporter permease subunit [Bryobacteraceae bacterium]
MLDSLIRVSLKYRGVVIALAVAFVAWGIAALPEVPLDVLPDITATTVTVMVEGRGMAPLELESLVTFPIEAAVNGAPGVRRVRSYTGAGFAIVHVDFDWGEEVYRARQTVTEKLALISGSLPEQVSRPLLAPVSSIMGEIQFVAMRSEDSSPEGALELRSFADNVMRRRLLSVAGVSQVVAMGGGRKQYEVRVDPVRLARYGMSLDEVERALAGASRNASPGFRLAGATEYQIQAWGRASNVEEIGAIPLRAAGTQPVRVRDVAEVAVGAALKRGDASLNGSPAVMLAILKQPGANTLRLTDAVAAELDEIERTMPKALKIDRFVFRQADFIERSLENLRKALRDGAILVVLVVLAFLMNGRAVGITLVALPVSLLAAVLALRFTGQSINSMSLGGLAIAIGELVDDAIIDVENVVRRLRENWAKPESGRLPSLDVVYRASSEIRGSVVFATIIVGIVFLPLFALDSVEGRLLRPLAFAYLAALAMSLVVALTVTPALCSLLLPRARSILGGREPWLVRQLKRAYKAPLRWSLDHPRSLAALALAAVVAAGVSTFSMGRAFLPEFNEGALTVGAVTLPGTSLEESNRLGTAAERIMLAIPEVVSTGRRTGRAELDEHGAGVETFEIDVRLALKDRSKDQVMNELRERLKLIPGTNFDIGQPISHRIDHMLSGQRSNIAVKLFGDDLNELRALAQRVETAMRPVAGVVDLGVERQVEVPTLRIRANDAVATRYGLSPGALAAKLETAVIGREVGRIYEGQVSYPLVLRFSGAAAGQAGANLPDTPLDTPAGARVRLSALATVSETAAPNFVSREGVQRKIVVHANVTGRDMRSTVEEIRLRVSEAVPLPPGYRIEYGGQFEGEERASRRLALLGIGVVAGILLLLATAFGSYREALLIMINLPLALVGGTIGVFASGGVLSLASIVGFIALLGIATRNGIMLIAHVKHLREKEGVADLREAVTRGAMERVSPILMTALAAGLALIPIALGAGQPGSEIQAPMATVILFGLASSTLLNMVVVPSLYFWSERRRSR